MEGQKKRKAWTERSKIKKKRLLPQAEVKTTALWDQCMEAWRGQTDCNLRKRLHLFLPHNTDESDASFKHVSAQSFIFWFLSLLQVVIHINLTPRPLLLCFIQNSLDKFFENLFSLLSVCSVLTSSFSLYSPKTAFWQGPWPITNYSKHSCSWFGNPKFQLWAISSPYWTSGPKPNTPLKPTQNKTWSMELSFYYISTFVNVSIITHVHQLFVSHECYLELCNLKTWNVGKFQKLQFF